MNRHLRSLSMLLLFAGDPVLPGEPDQAGATIRLREAAEETGLIFRHSNGGTGEYFLPEIMGSGAAVLDYDGDGDLDVYFLQGSSLLSTPVSEGGGGSKGRWGSSLVNRLFRNDLQNGRIRFTDVTEAAGVGGNSRFGMGAAVGDYDNDGDPDLYVTNFGSNILYRNNGDATFSDVTAEAGVDDPRWSSSAAFLDYNNDGRLDLFVVNYTDFTVKGNKHCHDAMGARDYCSPSVYRPQPDKLFRNDGNGKFSDVSETAGLSTAFGSGLGVTCADFDSNGFIDIYVANDGMANQLWLNQGNGIFEDIALVSGTAFNADGKAEAGMGVTAGDFDSDGDEDLFLTHLRNETATLYRNEGGNFFVDATIEAGLAVPTLPYTGFGTEWTDFDNDGHADLFIANGPVEILETLRGTEYPYHQPNQLFQQGADDRFRDVTGLAGEAMKLSEVSRGAAFADIDNDGDMDIIVSNNRGLARLYLNETQSGNHWLAIRLVGGERCDSQALSARIMLVQADGRRRWGRLHTDGSYMSANDPRVHFGLGKVSRVDSVVVRWPCGRVEGWKNPPSNRLLTLREATGQPATWNRSVKKGASSEDATPGRRIRTTPETMLKLYAR